MAAGETEAEELARPWEVVFVGRVKVRRAKDTTSEVLSAKLPGSILCGRREGEWLRLEGEPGFMLIATPDAELLREREEAPLSVLNLATGAELAALRAPTTACAGALKRRLAEVCGLPLYAMQLLLGARVLADDETLQSLGLPPSLSLVRLPFDEERGQELLRGVAHGDAAAVAEALRGRACPDFEGEQATPLLLAAGSGRLDLVVDLHVAGADKDRTGGQDGLSPLVAAASGGHAKVVRYLCEMAADVNKAMKDGVGALAAAATGGHLETLEYLVGAGAEVDRRSDVGATPLLLAAGGGHAELVRCLCKARADPELAMKDGRTPLQDAAREGHLEVLRELCEAAGAEKEARNLEGVTALIWAASHGRAEVVEYLLGARADPHLTAQHGGTPLLMASQNGHAEAASTLLFARADVDQPLDTGATPLLMAAWNGHLEVVRRLCEAGADKDRALADGGSPLDAASEAGHAEVARYLREAGASEGR